MRLFLILLLCPFISAATSFRVGLANIYFMGGIFENNSEKPLMGDLKHKTEPVLENEFDRLNVQFLARYIRYLDCDVLVLCEAMDDPLKLQAFSDTFLGGRYEVLHNSSVVKDRKHYSTQQIAVLVDRQKFRIRRYEALKKSEVTSDNLLYPYPPVIHARFKQEPVKFYWSRFPVEFDLFLQDAEGLNHPYKFIVTYPKSKYAGSDEEARKSRLQNYIQQGEIRRRVEHIAQGYEDYFVIGDMNDSLGMDEKEKELGIDSITSLWHQPEDAFLKNPLSYLLGQGTFIYKDVAETIDYILVSPGLYKGRGWVKDKVWEWDHFYRTMIRNLAYPSPDRLNQRELFLSDHGPVTLDVVH